MNNSLYIHIPFCRKKCLYCDFCSRPYDKSLAALYIEILRCQTGKLREKFSTIYIGGGTPTVLDKNLLKKILVNLKQAAAKKCEFSVEANPESLTADKLKLFLDCGVNRISIGLQSFYDDKLKKLGRIHSARQAKEAVILAKKTGFKNISIDLIFGVEDETLENWKKELNDAVKLPVKHISVYSLTYEKGTSLYKELKKKKITPLNDEVTAKMYKFAIDYLSKEGFIHYEVSNFASKGFSCRHNLNYWDNGAYIGLGASAVSYRQGVRSRYTPKIKDYIIKLDNGRKPVIFREKLSPVRRAKETAALKIRTKEGIIFKWFKAQTGFDFVKLEAESLERLIKEKLLKRRQRKGENIGVCLTEKGFLFCDAVCSSLL